jgi:cell division protein FtsB
MELPVGQIAPETLLDTFTTKFHTLSENLRKASAQVDRLKFDHHQLSAERDALTARVAALQTQIQDASIRQAPPVELLPFARRVLELSSKSGTLPPAQLQDSLMRLAIDAITQAEGSPAAAPATESPIHTTPLEPATASVATALPRPPQQTVSAPAPASVTPVDQKHDRDGSEPPVATQNRNTAKAEAKLEKALEYLISYQRQSAVSNSEFGLSLSQELTRGGKAGRLTYYYFMRANVRSSSSRSLGSPSFARVASIQFLSRVFLVGRSLSRKTPKRPGNGWLASR